MGCVGTVALVQIKNSQGITFFTGFFKSANVFNSAYHSVYCSVQVKVQTIHNLPQKTVLPLRTSVIVL